MVAEYQTTTHTDWQRVSPRCPCPICHPAGRPRGKQKGCLISPDGDVVCLHIESSEPATFGPGGWWHRTSEDTLLRFPVQRLEATPLSTVETADAATKDAVYTRLVELSPPSLADRDYLRSKAGHTDAMIAGNYGTLPRQDAQEALMTVLSEEFGADTLRTVPGIVTTNGCLRWTFSGLLIPHRDRHGRIVGCQVRVALPDGGKKYYWLSSTKDGGPGSGAPAHVARASMVRDHRIYVCESGKTANYLAHTFGATVVGLAGQTNHGPALHVLAALATEEDAEGATILLDAVDPADPDAARKEALTEQQRQALAVAVSRLGYHVKIGRWAHADGKGPDDVLMAGHAWTVERYRPPADESGRGSTTRPERGTHQEKHGHQENNAGDASTRKNTAPQDTPRRVYWTGPSPFNAVLRDEVGWGALVLRVYDAMCGTFGVVMGEPYPDGERPDPQEVLGKALAHETQDSASSVNAALTALTDGHYLTREIQRERDARGRTRRTWYVYGLPVAGAWEAWCDDPTLFAAPPPLRTTIASAAYRAERAELRRNHKEAVQELAAATTAHVEEPDDPTLFAALRRALDAYNEATAALAPRKRGRPSRASRQASPTMADDDRVFPGETVTDNGMRPSAPAAAHQEKHDVLLTSIEQVKHRVFPGEDDPYAAASDDDDGRVFSGEPLTQGQGEAADTATTSRVFSGEEAGAGSRVFPGERPTNDYLGGASSPPEVKMHPFERLIRRTTTRPPMPAAPEGHTTREYVR